MFAYPDAARYRLGVNYQQLPCNAPVSKVYTPYQRDGAFRYGTNYGGDPNYVRSSLKPINFKGQVGANGYAPGGHEEWVGQVAAYSSEVTDEDFVQAREMWDVLGKSDEQDDFVHNVAVHLKSALPQVQLDTIGKLTSPLISSRLYSIAVLTRSTRHVRKSRSGTWNRD
jgi:catalase